MSELNKSRPQDQLPSSSNSQQHIVIEANAPINAVFAANNFTCNAPLRVTVNQSIKKNDPEPPLKLMFQVKNPVQTFTGREEFLKELHERIQQCRKEGAMISIISHTSSITGLGGIGKSETVRMYIHKFGHEYDNVVWIDAEKPSEAEFQLTALAFHKLGIHIKNHNGNPRQFLQILEDIYEMLCKRPKLLLIILDNAEALDDTDTHALGIRQLLPSQILTIESPVILITSRQQYWEDMNVITLGLWEMEECLEFIYKRLHLTDTPENNKDATELAELFDRLPIALEVAAAVIAEQLRKRKAGGKRVYGISNLIEEYKAGDRKTLSKKTQQNSTQVTLQILLDVSLEKIRAYEEGELAIKILSFMAYLSPTSIPKEMMRELLSEADEDKLESAFALLADYSIIQTFESHFTIHRVFQDIIITILPDLKLQTVEGNADGVDFSIEVMLLTELISRFKEYASTITPIHDDYNDVVTNIVHSTDYIIQNAMAPHFEFYIKTFAEFIATTHCETAIRFYGALIQSDKSQAKVETKKLHDNLYSIGRIFLNNGKYVKAQETLQELLKMLEIAYSEITNLGSPKNKDNTEVEIPDIDKNEESDAVELHKDMLKTQMTIALCLTYQGKYEEALQLYYVVKTEQEKVLESLHPDILKTTSNIAHALFSQGRGEEAMELFNILDEDMEKVLGPLHELTLVTKMNKASTLSQQGKNDEALKLYNSLLKDQEQVLGPTHSNTLTTKLNIAKILTDQGNIEEALRINYSVEKDQEKVLGPLHPTTLTTKMNIAKCLFEQGKNEEALKINYLLEENMEKVLGPFHPTTLMAKKNIAGCLMNQGKHEEALEINHVLEKSMERALGPLHEHTLKTKVNIAACLSKLGRNNEALNLYSIVEKDQEKVLGPLHPDSLVLKINKAVALNEIGKTNEALKINIVLEKDMEKVFGPLHSYTLLAKSNIANYLSHQGRCDEALQRYYVVEKSQVKVLGPLHPYTLTTKMNIALCLGAQGKFEEALKLLRILEKDQEKVLGPLHPAYLECKKKITVCLNEIEQVYVD